MRTVAVTRVRMTATRLIGALSGASYQAYSSGAGR